MLCLRSFGLSPLAAASKGVASGGGGVPCYANALGPQALATLHDSSEASLLVEQADARRASTPLASLAAASEGATSGGAGVPCHIDTHQALAP